MAKIKKGDLVQVISGKSQARGGDHGKQGKVIAQTTDAMARQLLDIHSYAAQVLGPQQHNGISLSTGPYTGHMPATSKEAHP